MLLDYSCERNITQAAASLLGLKLNPREEFQGRKVGSASQEGFGVSLRAILQSNFFFHLLWILVALCRLSLAAASGDCSPLRCVGFSLRWLLLPRSTGSGCVGFSSCNTRAQ